MIKLHTSTDGQYYFTLCGRNGKIIMTSETYPTMKNLNRAVESTERIISFGIVKIKDLTKQSKKK